MKLNSENPSVFDVPTNETLEFGLKYLPNRNSRILEIGCGGIRKTGGKIGQN
jgi:hypothetical protein